MGARRKSRALFRMELCESFARAGYLLCFQRRKRPTRRPRPHVPSRNGRATGSASHATTASPRETIAPALLPGMVTLPNPVREAGRGVSVRRNIEVHLL